jgi:hypothetical protein
LGGDRHDIPGTKRQKRIAHVTPQIAVRDDA